MWMFIFIANNWVSIILYCNRDFSIINIYIGKPNNLLNCNILFRPLISCDSCTIEAHYCSSVDTVSTLLQYCAPRVTQLFIGATYWYRCMHSYLFRHPHKMTSLVMLANSIHGAKSEIMEGLVDWARHSGDH
ncbi:hypothetical protein PF008_g27191 [Phytophthora fragariae]|uniref:Uncharacterized protein n=1 Tax=Phytophthora fragariae TaxID=53985 RepID=A0A6G0QEW9_9STRA|nr:hypothetical protein PF008_g27191 [Phytophthora fragariae]